MTLFVFLIGCQTTKIRNTYSEEIPNPETWKVESIEVVKKKDDQFIIDVSVKVFKKNEMMIEIYFRNMTKHKLVINADITQEPEVSYCETKGKDTIAMAFDGKPWVAYVGSLKHKNKYIILNRIDYNDGLNGSELLFGSYIREVKFDFKKDRVYLSRQKIGKYGDKAVLLISEPITGYYGNWNKYHNSYKIKITLKKKTLHKF